MAKKKAAKKKAAKIELVEETSELRLVEIAELFTVSPGVLMTGLSDDQYRRRKDRLMLVDGKGDHTDQSVYKSDTALQFKVGERLMIECGDIHKSHLSKLIMVD